MSGASFKFKTTEFKKILNNAIKNTARTQQLAEAIGEANVASTRQRFKDEHGPEGEKWEKSIRAKATGGQTLTDNADLKNSVNYEATNTMVAVGTNKIYAAIHQFGGKIKPKKKKSLAFKIGDKNVVVKEVTMPPRPFIGFSKDDISEAKEIVKDYMQKGFK